MRKRINNDFDSLVEVLHEGVKIDLSLYEITSVRMVSNQAYQVNNYEIRNGSLFLHVTPLIAPKIGKYKIVVTYRMADPTLADGFWNYEFDKYLVTIVGCSEEEDAGDVVITADAVIGMQGKSAYQVWLEAGNVGTLEDYLADIKGDPFRYDDFTPEQLEALKVKGDPFLYEDFTPEQIAELQQPATDAIVAVNEAEALRVTAENTRVQNEQGRVTAEGTRQQNETARVNAENDRDEAEALRLSAETARGQNEQERVTAEGLRVTAEGLRQTNTSTAITNANNAATNANTKAGLADTAANNANTKATLANDAAILANEKAGLANTAATNADNARLAIQGDLAGKEASTNKQNSLATDGTGTKFPTVDAVNAGLVANSNLLYQYIHSGNIEVYISAIDYATHTFTSVDHGLKNGDRLGLKIIEDGIIENIIPFTNAMPQDSSQSGYYVVNIGVDTFQISATLGGAPITTINKATQNFTKWRFEKLELANITLPNIPPLGCDIELIGDLIQFNRYVNEDSYRSLSLGYCSGTVTQTALVHSNTYLLKGWYRISVRKTEYSMFVNRKYKGIQLDTANSARIKWVDLEIYMVTSGVIDLIDNIVLSTIILTNGTIVNVYKI